MDNVRIRRLRVLLGMSQPDLADLLGVSTTTWNRYEKGHTKPSQWLSDLLKVCEHVAADARTCGEFRALRETTTERPALLWFLLNKAYQSRFVP